MLHIHYPLVKYVFWCLLPFFNLFRTTHPENLPCVDLLMHLFQLVTFPLVEHHYRHSKSNTVCEQMIPTTMSSQRHLNRPLQYKYPKPKQFSLAQLMVAACGILQQPGMPVQDCLRTQRFFLTDIPKQMIGSLKGILINTEMLHIIIKTHELFSVKGVQNKR
ncbi:hypothetical protein XELAEV_18037285mg [Xenopus laevis]|uniref:Uncharacterized protein n=1 Tax=Xenopus laevis TaxID=8355 RepID=A0A974HA12_XENLA|nr:hypothetical protein XELAEV_18037285mg [Xenopus laevis]